MAKKSGAATRLGRKIGPSDNTRSGFTIIEVVLVLAVAGLIMLMVFLALPALQRAQKDTQRKNAMGEVATAIMNYQSNNNGKLPADGKQAPVEPNADGVVKMTTSCAGNSACNLIKNYLNGAGAENNEFIDPSGTAYGLSIAGNDTIPDSFDFDKTIYVYKGAVCDGETAKASSNARDYAIVMKLEGSGTTCRTNSGGA